MPDCETPRKRPLLPDCGVLGGTAGCSDAGRQESKAMRSLDVHMTPAQFAAYNRGGECKPLLKDDLEKTYQARVNGVFKDNGWELFHDSDPKHNSPGFPDIAAYRFNAGGKPRVIMAELKTKRRGLTPEQYFWLLALCAMGDVEVYVWYAERQEDWSEIYRVSIEEG